MIMPIIRSSRNPRLPQLQPLSARYNLIKKERKKGGGKSCRALFSRRFWCDSRLELGSDISQYGAVTTSVGELADSRNHRQVSPLLRTISTLQTTMKVGYNRSNRNVELSWAPLRLGSPSRRRVFTSCGAWNAGSNRLNRRSWKTA